VRADVSMSMGRDEVLFHVKRAAADPMPIPRSHDRCVMRVADLRPPESGDMRCERRCSPLVGVPRLVEGQQTVHPVLSSEQRQGFDAWLL
jgi:hypothetical protein